MKRKRFLRWAIFVGLGAVALSIALFIIREIFYDGDRRVIKKITELQAQYTPVTLEEVIKEQNLQEVNLAIPIYDKKYQFRTRKGSLTVNFTRCYNLSNETLFDGNHSVGFDYSKSGRRSRRIARKIEKIIEEDPLIAENADSLYSFFEKNGQEIKSYIEKICLPGENVYLLCSPFEKNGHETKSYIEKISLPTESQKFDGLLTDLAKLVEEDKFSLDKPFEAVLINNCNPVRSQGSPNKLDNEIRTRLLSPDNQFGYISRDEIERLNQIFKEKADKGEFDIKESSFGETILFYLKTIPKHFTVYMGEALFDERKNRLNPSEVFANPNRIEVSCGPPAHYIVRLINYANEVNPNFKHIHAFFTLTTNFKERGKERDYSHHAIVALVDTENQQISFLDPFALVVLPFVKPHRYDGHNIRTSRRKELIAWLPGAGIVGNSAAGLSYRQFLEESRRNAERDY